MADAIIPRRTVVVEGGGLANGQYEVLADIQILEDSTVVDINGLSIDSTDELLLVSNLQNKTATNSNYYLFVNGNTTVSNYFTQGMYINAASRSSSRVTTPIMATQNGGYHGITVTSIKVTDFGYFVADSTHTRNYYQSSVIVMEDYLSTGIFSITSIESLRVSATATGAISEGSRFTLYKRAGE